MISGRPTLGIYVNSDFRLTFDPLIEQQPANGHKRRIQSESAASLLPPLSSIDLDRRLHAHSNWNNRHRRERERLCTSSNKTSCDAIPRQSFEIIVNDDHHLFAERIYCEHGNTDKLPHLRWRDVHQNNHKYIQIRTLLSMYRLQFQLDLLHAIFLRCLLDRCRDRASVDHPWT